MATATETRHTPEDLLAIKDRPMPELVDGRLIKRPLMGQESDAIAAMLLGLIWSYVQERTLGMVNGSQGAYQIFPDDPNKVRIPDVSFTRKDRVPPGGPARGHSRVRPDLVVEVVSPNDTDHDLDAKVGDFLAAGVPLIWVANPETRSVQVHRADGSGSRLTLGETLDGESILPGFRVEVARIFEGLVRSCS